VPAGATVPRRPPVQADAGTGGLPRLRRRPAGPAAAAVGWRPRSAARRAGPAGRPAGDISRSRRSSLPVVHQLLDLCCRAAGPAVTRPRLPGARTHACESWQ